MCGWREVYSEVHAYAPSKINCTPIRGVFYRVRTIFEKDVVEAQLRISAIGARFRVEEHPLVDCDLARWDVLLLNCVTLLA